MRKFIATLFAGLVLVAAVAPAADAGKGGNGGNGGSRPCICTPPLEIM
jgi:hypothetical protein